MEVLKDNFTSPLVLATVISSSTVAGLSTVACIAALVTLVCFKMYRHFAYRLVFYTLLTLTLFSLSDMLYLILMYVDENGLLDQIELFLGFIYTTAFCCSLVLMVCYTFYFYTMAVRYQQYNRWIYDFNCLLLSIVLSLIYTGMSFSLCHGKLVTLVQYNNLSPAMGCTIDENGLLDQIELFLGFIYTTAFCCSLVLMVCYTFYFYTMAVRYQQYNRWIYDFNCLLLSIVLSLIYTGMSFSLCHGKLVTLVQYNNLSPAMGCTIDEKGTIIVMLAMIVVGSMLIVTSVFMFAALITLCSKAYRQEDFLIKRSYKQALKERGCCTVPK